MWHDKCSKKILQGGEKVERSTRKGVVSILLSEGLIALVHFPGLELGALFWEGSKVLRTGLGVQC